MHNNLNPEVIGTLISLWFCLKTVVCAIKIINVRIVPKYE